MLACMRALVPNLHEDLVDLWDAAIPKLLTSLTGMSSSTLRAFNPHCHSPSSVSHTLFLSLSLPPFLFPPFPFLHPSFPPFPPILPSHPSVPSFLPIFSSYSFLSSFPPILPSHPSLSSFPLILPSHPSLSSSGQNKKKKWNQNLWEDRMLKVEHMILVEGNI